MPATDDLFARDLGYLDAFFSKLEAHSNQMTPEAGARLRTLVAEERSRWSEIRRLLAPSVPGAKPASTSPPSESTAPRQNADTRPRPELTVGNLFGVAKRGG